MRLLLDHNHDVPRLDPRRLIRLARERDGLALLHPPVDKDLEHLALVDNLLAQTALAAVLGVDDLALAVAVLAGLLDLLHHRAQLAENHLDTLAVTALARLDRALLAALALALGAEDVLLQRQLGRLALVEVLERDLDAVHEILALSGPLRTPPAPSTTSAAKEAAAAAKELGEEILGVHPAWPAAAAARESLFAVLVVHPSLVGIGQNFVRCTCQQRSSSGAGVPWDTSLN